MDETQDLKERLEARRDALEEELKMQADDSDLRDLLDDVEDALKLLDDENGLADLSRLEELDARVASRLEK